MSTFAPASVYGIIGYPLGHTLSPLLHTTSFRCLGMDAVLVPWPVEPDRLGDFVDAFRLLRLSGSCVTIPHKERVIPLLDRVTDRASAVGAVNTLYWDGTELCGDNTDVPGFVAPLADLSRSFRRAIVLGGGGASRAVLAGLKTQSIGEIYIANRTEATARLLADEFAVKVWPWEARAELDADLVVNTTPLGMKGKAEEETPYPVKGFKRHTGVAYDIVYTPLKTRFLKEAAEAGWDTISGVGMFIGQADWQCRLWTGNSLPEGAKTAVYEVLGAED